MKILFTIVLLLFTTMSLYPCSIFKYTVGRRTYFCGNEDWTATNPAIKTFPAKDNGYGFIVFGWGNLLPRYIQAGINSEGLCFDWAAVPPQLYVRDADKKDLTLDFTLDILRKCATVSDAIDYIKRHNIPHLAEEHIMFADKTGKSCVIEYNHSQLRIVQNDLESQFITNFHITDNSLGWYPCDRYSKMAAFFMEKGNKEALLVDLLEAVHQEGQYPTVYSYVFDLTKMEITVFHNHNYRAKRIYSLDKLIVKESIIELSF